MNWEAQCDMLRALTTITMIPSLAFAGSPRSHTINEPKISPTRVAASSVSPPLNDPMRVQSSTHIQDAA
jgi:hypothetical protein